MSDLRLNRAQLAEFLRNPQAIKAFEQLFIDVREGLPDNLEDIQIGAETAQLQAAEALAGLAVIANQLSLLLMAPAVQAASQDAYTLPQDPWGQVEQFSPPTVEQIAQQVLELISAQVVEQVYQPPSGDLGTMAAQNASNVNISGGSASLTSLTAQNAISAQGGIYRSTGQQIIAGSTTTTLFTLPSGVTNHSYLLTVRQSGAAFNLVVGVIFAHSGSCKVLRIIQDNTNPALDMNLTQSGLDVQLVLASGFGSTNWEWVLTRLK